MKNSVLLSLLLCACSSTPDTPTPEASQATESKVSTKKNRKNRTKETKAERTARLNRAADIRAGIDPDKPLPKWQAINFGKSKSDNAHPEMNIDCKVGKMGEVEVQHAGKTVSQTGLDALLAGEQAISVQLTQDKTVTVLSVARLAPKKNKTVEAVSCDGTVIEIPGNTLSSDTAWVLMKNKKGFLKLLDWRETQKPTQPKGRGITVLRQK